MFGIFKLIKYKPDKSKVEIWLVGFFICVFFFGAVFSQIAAFNLCKNSSESVDSDAVCMEEKKIAITFDDGPHPIYTPMLLDGLRERGIKATFFVIGENAQEYPEIIEQMKEDGHLIGNHTFHHIQLRDTNYLTFRKELIATNETISKITGDEVIFVRPPYGTWDKMLDKDLNMIPVLWTVDPVDWATCDEGQIITNTIRKVKENDIILLHDVYETSVNAALAVIDEEIKRGYSFVTVDEILFD